MPFTPCGAGYQCVSHLKAFGIGHTNDVAADRVKHFGDKFQSKVDNEITDNANSNTHNIYTALRRAFGLAEPNAVGLGGDTPPLYEVGCPFRGKKYNFATKGGSDPACYPRDSSTSAFNQHGDCDSCMGFSADGYDESLCKNQINGNLKPCL